MDLRGYRVIAFATHGLVPGDLAGLTQPALALTAPDVAGIEGDGLLTMEKILGQAGLRGSAVRPRRLQLRASDLLGTLPPGG
jgi:hypothetical protein